MSIIDAVLSFFGIIEYIKRFLGFIKNKLRPKPSKSHLSDETPETTKQVAINVIDSPNARVEVYVSLPSDDKKAKEIHNIEKCNKKGCKKKATTIADHNGKVFCSIKHAKQFYGTYEADREFLKKIRGKGKK